MATPASAPAGDQKSQLQALRKIDALSEKLQKEGKLLEALQCMEKSLILRGHVFGLDSVEVYRACKSVGEMCNYLAMTYLQQDEFDITLELLKKAEVLTERHRAVRAVTYNNLGCFYRKRGKLRTALSYVSKALAIESKLKDNAKAADTHLNMCTILSELKRHDKALVHAKTALKLLLLELFGPRGYHALPPKGQGQGQGQSGQLPPIQGARGGGAGAGAAQPAAGGAAAAESKTESKGGEQKKPKLPDDRVAVLAIAYHNLAVQQEFLKEFKESLTSYEKACKVVTTHLGEGHPLVNSLTDSYNNAKSKLTEQMKQQEEKQTKRRAPYAARAKGDPARSPMSTQELKGMTAQGSASGGADGGGADEDSLDVSSMSVADGGARGGGGAKKESMYMSTDLSAKPGAAAAKKA